MRNSCRLIRVCGILAVLFLIMILCPQGWAESDSNSVNVLFLGNSFTYGLDLTGIFKTLSEEGQPGLDTSVTTATYGGSSLFHQWHLKQSYNIVRIHSITRQEMEREMAQLDPANIPEIPPDWFVQAEGKEAPRKWKNLTTAKTLKHARAQHEKWLKLVGKAPKWDYVVLQSWKDMDENKSGSYFIYASKFAEVARREGASPVLYITSSYSQNMAPVKGPSAPGRSLKETRQAKDLAEKIDALVVPMPLAIYYCQQERPDITFRYVNNFHLNHNSAYLAACLMYGAIHNASPQGLPFNVVVGLGSKPDVDHDGNPRRQVLSDDIRLYLQKLAWRTLQAFDRGEF